MAVNFCQASSGGSPGSKFRYWPRSDGFLNPLRIQEVTRRPQAFFQSDLPTPAFASAFGARLAGVDKSFGKAGFLYIRRQ